MISVYVVYDCKFKKFGSVMLYPNDDMAIREMIYRTELPGSFMKMFPSDYELWKVGEFEEETGTLISADDFEGKHMIGRVIDFIGGE